MGEVTNQHNGFSRFALACEYNCTSLLTIESVRDEESDSSASSCFVKPPFLTSVLRSQSLVRARFWHKYVGRSSCKVS